MDVKFEKAFLKAVKKHAGIKRQIDQPSLENKQRRLDVSYFTPFIPVIYGR